MDWIPDFLKGKLLQGFVLGLAAGIALAIALTDYDVREFNALGFHFTIPDRSAKEFESLEETLGKIRADLELTKRELATRESELAQMSRQSWSELPSPEVAELKSQISVLQAIQSETGIALREKEALVIKLKSEIADLAAQKEADANKLKAELAKIQKERNSLAAQTAAFDKKLKSATAALNEANKKIASMQSATSKSAKKCTFPNAATNGRIQINTGESWNGLDDQIVLRIKTLSGEESVSFYSNLPALDGPIFKAGADLRFRMGECNYVLRIVVVSQVWRYVVVDLFPL